MRWPRLPPSYSVPRIDRQLDLVEAETGVVGLRRVAHVVEHEELGFRAEEDRIAHAHRLDLSFGLLGDAARVAVVGLAGGRLEHVAGQHQRGLGKERIDRRGDRVRHQAHVGLVDRLPAGDRRTVEHDAFGEGVFLDHRHVERDVLPLAARVREAEVDILDVIVLDLLQDILCGRHGLATPLRCRASSDAGWLE